MQWYNIDVTVSHVCYSDCMLSVKHKIYLFPLQRLPSQFTVLYYTYFLPERSTAWMKKKRAGRTMFGSSPGPQTRVFAAFGAAESAPRAAESAPGVAESAPRAAKSATTPESSGRNTAKRKRDHKNSRSNMIVQCPPSAIVACLYSSSSWLTFL